MKDDFTMIACIGIVVGGIIVVSFDLRFGNPTSSVTDWSPRGIAIVGDEDQRLFPLFSSS
ncbi:hypothetical protein BT63DRAFT_421329 [Microthyrium microscopicum]|uniref:Uncharacterized protein n=1 Tax=Microthyrium microscopicum TaxID=703497 RepID=A0A6A6UNW9_9PEZI|nr:hypothetical protein BT63DRAFT_421329 [Microthyrium microscopicum]